MNVQKGIISAKKVVEFEHVVAEFKRKFPKAKLMLDSGAFTAFKGGFTIDVYEYIKFVEQHGHLFDSIVALDDISDPEITWNNFRIMQNAGIKNCIPTFHATKESDDVLVRLVDNAEYVGFGAAESAIRVDIYHNVLYNKDGSLRFPDTKFHGFAVGAPNFFQVYPWYSCDASNASIKSRYGKVCIINLRNGIFEMTEFHVSSKQKKRADHYVHLVPEARKAADELFQYHGYSIEDFDEEYYEKEEEGEALHQRMLFSIEVYTEAIRKFHEPEKYGVREIRPVPRIF